jgi:hypothetical protein
MQLPIRFTAFGWFTVSLIAVFMFGSLEGCGRKLPPIQPGTYPPPAVKGLAFEVKDGELTLSWTCRRFRRRKARRSVLKFCAPGRHWPSGMPDLHRAV